MERWVENTFRTIGILLLSAVVLILAAVLLLLSICSSGSFNGGRQSAAGAGFLVAAIVVFVLGIFLIIRLARGMFRASRAAGAQHPNSQTEGSALLVLTPEVRRTTQAIVYLIIAKIVAGYIGWIFLAQTPGVVYTPRFTLLLGSFLITQMPFIVLGALLLMRPSAAVLTFTLVFTIISALKFLPSLQFLLTRGFRPGPLALTIIALLFVVAIGVVAFKALQKGNARLQPPTVVLAVVCTLIYFYIVGVVTPILYRLG